MKTQNASLCLVTLVAFSAMLMAQAQPQAPLSGTKPQPPQQSSGPMSGQQMTNIPYFSQAGGMHSVLMLNNNTPGNMQVEVTIFNPQGKSLMVPITLKPGAANFRLEDLTSGMSDDFSLGNIEIMFMGGSMAVTSQVGIFWPEKRISFESRESDMMDFASSQMNGIVWLPDAGSKASLALTNTASKAVHINLSVGDHARVLSLRPRETRVLRLGTEMYSQHEDEANGAGRAMLVRLSQDGAPGNVIGTGFVLNPETGYSSDFALVDPATSRTTKLAGAGVRFGYADVTEGFPVGTKFRAPLVLANVGTKPVMARVSVDFTLSGTPTSLGVSEQQIMPGELKIVELTKEMARLGVTGPVDDAGVDVSYRGGPGSLIGHLTSVDQTGNYAFVVPIKDPDEISHMSGNTYPWSLENGDQTVLHLKNTTDKPVWVMVQIRFEGGSYNPDRIQLQPFQTVNLDIQKLKDSKQKDVRGNILPKTAMYGQVEWIEETPGSMIGRAEQTNIAAGTARSFSCSTCPCDNDFYDATMTPDSFIGPVGGSGSPFRPVYRTQDCNGDILGPYSMSPNAWSSSNSSVASVTNTGYVSCLAGGSATIGASMNYDNYYYTGPYNGNQCVAEPFTPQTGSGGNMSVCDFTISPSSLTSGDCTNGTRQTQNFSTNLTQSSCMSVYKGTGSCSASSTGTVDLDYGTPTCNFSSLVPPSATVKYFSGPKQPDGNAGTINMQFKVDFQGASPSHTDSATVACP